jgi:hypothetical protein
MAKSPLQAFLELRNTLDAAQARRKAAASSKTPRGQKKETHPKHVTTVEHSDALKVLQNQEKVLKSARKHLAAEKKKARVATLFFLS